MKHFRSGLTRLKSLMEQKLPDGNDIYGYPGVTKPSLLAALDVAYTLSQAIKENAESRFEVISLKRSGSDLYKNLKEFLEGDSTEQEKSVGFNDFLNSLIALIEKTKITYFIVAKNGIRDDEELVKIRVTIADLIILGDELKEQKETVVSEVESISDAIDGINKNHKDAKQRINDMEAWHDTTKKHYTKMEETHEAIEGWDEDIKECEIQFQTLSKQISEQAREAAQSRDELNSSAIAGKAKVRELTKTASEHNDLLNEIRQTLEGANRVGMAASFKTRKDELLWQQLAWQIVFIGAISMIVLAVWRFVLPTIAETQSTGDWSKLIAELGLVSPLIWLGWFAAKQYGYTSKIREDYAFKSAAAMAYEGHKKAAREVDEELERTLLELSLYNLSQNPIRLYGKGEMHATPIHEAMSQVLEKFPKLKKASAEIPPLGKVEVVGEESNSEED